MWNNTILKFIGHITVDAIIFYMIYQIYISGEYSDIFSNIVYFLFWLQVALAWLLLVLDKKDISNLKDKTGVQPKWRRQYCLFSSVIESCLLAGLGWYVLAAFYIFGALIMDGVKQKILESDTSLDEDIGKVN